MKKIRRDITVWGVSSFDLYRERSFSSDSSEISKVYKIISYLISKNEMDEFNRLMEERNVAEIALFGGVLDGNVQFVRTILSKKQNLFSNQVINKNFIFAAGKESDGIVDLLLSYGADDYAGAVISAIKNQKIERAELIFFKEGIDYFKILSEAWKNRCSELPLMEKWISKAVEEDSYGFGIVLKKSVENGNDEVLNLVLKVGGKNFPPYFVKKALKIAEANGKQRMKKLIEIAMLNGEDSIKKYCIKQGHSSPHLLLKSFIEEKEFLLYKKGFISFGNNLSTESLCDLYNQIDSLPTNFNDKTKDLLNLTLDRLICSKHLISLLSLAMEEGINISVDTILEKSNKNISENSQREIRKRVKREGYLTLELLMDIYEKKPNEENTKSFWNLLNNILQLQNRMLFCKLIKKFNGCIKDEEYFRLYTLIEERLSENRVNCVFYRNIKRDLDEIYNIQSKINVIIKTNTLQFFSAFSLFRYAVATQNLDLIDLLIRKGFKTPKYMISKISKKNKKNRVAMFFKVINLEDNVVNFRGILDDVLKFKDRILFYRLLEKFNGCIGDEEYCILHTLIEERLSGDSYIPFFYRNIKKDLDEIYNMESKIVKIKILNTPKFFSTISLFKYGVATKDLDLIDLLIKKGEKIPKSTIEEVIEKNINNEVGKFLRMAELENEEYLLESFYSTHMDLLIGAINSGNTPFFKAAFTKFKNSILNENYFELYTYILKLYNDNKLNSVDMDHQPLLKVHLQKVESTLKKYFDLDKFVNYLKSTNKTSNLTFNYSVLFNYAVEKEDVELLDLILERKSSSIPVGHFINGYERVKVKNTNFLIKNILALELNGSDLTFFSSEGDFRPKDLLFNFAKSGNIYFLKAILRNCADEISLDEIFKITFSLAFYEKNGDFVKTDNCKKCEEALDKFIVKKNQSTPNCWRAPPAA